MKKKEKRSNSIRKQTWFSWRTNGIQSFIGWFPFLSFSIGWTVFIPGPKKKKTTIGWTVFIPGPKKKKTNGPVAQKQTKNFALCFLL
jgi:hypothetical protein